MPSSPSSSSPLSLPRRSSDLILLDQFHGALGRELRETLAELRAGAGRGVPPEAAAAVAGQRIERILERSAIGLRLVDPWRVVLTDRKSTRLNSSHGYISYAVFTVLILPSFPTTTLFRSHPAGPVSRRPGPGASRDARRAAGRRRAGRAAGSRRRSRGPAHRADPRAVRDRSAPGRPLAGRAHRSEEHTSELQSRLHLVCRLHRPHPPLFPYHDALPISSCWTSFTAPWAGSFARRSPSCGPAPGGACRRKPPPQSRASASSGSSSGPRSVCAWSTPGGSCSQIGRAHV